MITSPETNPPIIRASLWAHAYKGYHRRRPNKGQIKMALGSMVKLSRKYKNHSGSHGRCPAWSRESGGSNEA